MLPIIHLYAVARPSGSSGLKMLPTPQAFVYAKRQPTDRRTCFLDADALRTLGKVSPCLYNRAGKALTRWLVWDPLVSKWLGFSCASIRWFSVDYANQFRDLRIMHEGKLVQYSSVARGSRQ